MMSKEIEKMHQEIATRNSINAVKKANEVEKLLLEEIGTLRTLVIQHHEQLAQLQQKYNLLLTKNFTGGSTANVS